MNYTPSWIEAVVADWDGEYVITSPHPYPSIHSDLPLRVFKMPDRAMCAATEGPHICVLIDGHHGPHWRCVPDLAESGPLMICQKVEVSVAQGGET